MKRFTFIIIIILFSTFLAGFFILRPTTPPEKPGNVQESQPTTTPQQIQNQTVTVNNRTYRYALIGPISPQQASLFSNLPEKQSSTTLMETFSCDALVSAGFYGTDDKHLGLFIEKGELIRKEMNSNLFNGFVSISYEGKGDISEQVSNESIQYALQTGPILINNGTNLPLQIRDDEFARRIALGKTTDGSFVWYALVSDQNTFNGPLLEELPQVIQAINEKEELSVPIVINLDGGNHSVMLSNDIQLSELSPVGGIFCIKND